MLTQFDEHSHFKSILTICTIMETIIMPIFSENFTDSIKRRYSYDKANYIIKPLIQRLTLLENYDGLVLWFDTFKKHYDSKSILVNLAYDVACFGASLEDSNIKRLCLLFKKRHVEIMQSRLSAFYYLNGLLSMPISLGVACLGFFSNQYNTGHDMYEEVFAQQIAQTHNEDGDDIVPEQYVCSCNCYQNFWRANTLIDFFNREKKNCTRMLNNMPPPYRLI